MPYLWYIMGTCLLAVLILLLTYFTTYRTPCGTSVQHDLTDITYFSTPGYTVPGTPCDASLQHDCYRLTCFTTPGSTIQHSKDNVHPRTIYRTRYTMWCLLRLLIFRITYSTYSWCYSGYPELREYPVASLNRRSYCNYATLLSVVGNV